MRQKTSLWIMALLTGIISFTLVFVIVDYSEFFAYLDNSGGIPFFFRDANIDISSNGVKEDLEDDEYILPDHIDVFFQLSYLGCEHVELFDNTKLSNILGTSSRILKDEYEKTVLDFINRTYPEWALYDLSDYRIILYREKDGFCPEDTTYRHIGIQGGYVAVYLGKPGPEPRLLRITRIEIKNLPSTEVQKIREGIVVTSEEEELKILEGLASLVPY